MDRLNEESKDDAVDVQTGNFADNTDGYVILITCLILFLPCLVFLILWLIRRRVKSTAANNQTSSRLTTETTASRSHSEHVNFKVYNSIAKTHSTCNVEDVVL